MKFLSRALYLCLAVMLVALATPAAAQEEEETVTDEELEAFVTMEDSIAMLKEVKTDEFNEMLRTHELMDGGRRYLEIKEVWGDEEAMAEAEVTEAEKEAFETIQEMYDNIAQSLRDAKISYIKEVLTVSVYNKVNGALKQDEELKVRFEEMLEAKAEAREASDEEEESAESN